MGKHIENFMKVEISTSEFLEVDILINDYYKHLEGYYNEFIEEYNSVKFIVSLGFENFERNYSYYNHKKKISEYLNYKEMLQLYKKIKFPILTKKLKDIFINKYEFEYIEPQSYIYDIPNENIINIKNALVNLRKNIDFYEMFDAYCTNNIFSCDKKKLTDFMITLINKKKIIHKLEIEDDNPHSFDYKEWSIHIKYKPIIILKNKNLNIVLYKLNEDCYINLHNWGELDALTLNQYRAMSLLD